MPSESGAESLEQPAAQVGTGAASAVATVGAAGGGPDPEASSASLGRHQSRLSWPQVKRLDALLKEPIPIHGRGNFPTLSVQPQQIVQVRGPWQNRGWVGALLQGTWSLRLARQLKKLRNGNPSHQFGSSCALLSLPVCRSGNPLLGTSHQGRWVEMKEALDGASPWQPPMRNVYTWFQNSFSSSTPHPWTSCLLRILGALYLCVPTALGSRNLG